MATPLLTSVGSSSQFIFSNVEIPENYESDLSNLVLSDLLTPVTYTIQGNDISVTTGQHANLGHPINDANSIQVHFNIMEKGKTDFGPPVFHFCDLVTQTRERRALDGCLKLGVSGKVNNEYIIPVWQIGEFKFRNRIDEIVTVNDWNNTGYFDGILGKEITNFYLIPLILPTRLVVYYVFQDKAVIKAWHQKVNTPDPQKPILMVGAKKPLLYDDDLSTFVTSEAELDWYAPANNLATNKEA